MSARKVVGRILAKADVGAALRRPPQQAEQGYQGRARHTLHYGRATPRRIVDSG